MTQTKLVNLMHTINPDYQKKIHDTTNEILQNQKEISINDLKSNSIFQRLIKSDDTKLQTNLWDKIKSIAGDIIDKTELKTIIILLDAHLEKINDLKSEDFCFDNQYELNENSGIFHATKDEIDTTLNVIQQFDFDNPKIEYFPKVIDNKIEIYDRNNKKVDERPIQ